MAVETPIPSSNIKENDHYKDAVKLVRGVAVPSAAQVMKTRFTEQLFDSLVR